MRPWLVAITATLMLNPLVAHQDDTNTPGASALPPASQAHLRAPQPPGAAFILGQYLLAMVLASDGASATSLTAGRAEIQIRPKPRGGESLFRALSRAGQCSIQHTRPGEYCPGRALGARHTPVDARLHHRGPPSLR